MLAEVSNLVHGSSWLLVFFIIIVASNTAHLVAVVGVAASIIHILLGRVLCDVLWVTSAGSFRWGLHPVHTFDLRLIALWFPHHQRRCFAVERIRRVGVAQ